MDISTKALSGCHEKVSRHCHETLSQTTQLGETKARGKRENKQMHLYRACKERVT